MRLCSPTVTYQVIPFTFFPSIISVNETSRAATGWDTPEQSAPTAHEIAMPPESLTWLSHC